MVSVLMIKLEHGRIFSHGKNSGCFSDNTYKLLYGLSLFQIYIVMSYLSKVHHPPDYSRFSTKHVLWTLYFLKNYPLKTTAARTLKTSEVTFDKYVWYCIKLISEIDNVSAVNYY